MQKGELLAQWMRGEAFPSVHDFRHTQGRIGFDEPVDMVRHDFPFVYLQAQFLGLLLPQSLPAAVDRLHQYRAAVLRAPHQVILQAEDAPAFLAYLSLPGLII